MFPEFQSQPLAFRPGTFSVSWGFLPPHPLLSAMVIPSIKEGCACAMDTSQGGAEGTGSQGHFPHGHGCLFLTLALFGNLCLP